MTAVHLRGVEKSFGDVAIIKGIDLTIESGKFTVFVGPSGCGKSTLLRLIAGLEHVSRGELLVDGTRVNEVPPSRRGMAMVFQSYALYPHMNVYKNLAFGIETSGMPKAEIARRVQQAAQILQIEALLSRKPRELSGGQRQRVAIGRAIVRDPKVFLFDEPLSNLDAELRIQMRIELARLHRNLGATMVYVTHDQVEAMTMADKIVVLRAGHIEQEGHPLQLYNNPRNQFVAGFIGNPKMNFLDVEQAPLQTGGTAVAFGETRLCLPLAAREGSAAVLGIRPEHVTLTGDGVSLGKAQVRHVEHLGGSTLIYSELADGQSVSVEWAGQQSIRPGDILELSVDTARCHLFDSNGDAFGAIEGQQG